MHWTTNTFHSCAVTNSSCRHGTHHKMRPISVYSANLFKWSHKHVVMLIGICIKIEKKHHCMKLHINVLEIYFLFPMHLQNITNQTKCLRLQYSLGYVSIHKHNCTAGSSQNYNVVKCVKESSTVFIVNNQLVYNTLKKQQLVQKKRQL